MKLLAGFEKHWSTQGSIVPLLLVERQLRQWLHAHQADDEDGCQDEAEERKNVLHQAQAFPALALGIEEDLFGH